MNNNVYIKSFKNGLQIHLSDDCPFQDICDEIKVKFSESKSFFKGGRIAVSFEGRILSLKEERILVSLIETNADLTVLYVLGKDEETEALYLKAVDRPVCGILDDSLFGKFYYGNIKRNERIDSEHGVIIIGDIEPGAIVTAKGNIIVIGGIYGSAVCVGEKANEYFIASYDMNAEKLLIGDYRYFSKEKPKWVVKPKLIPKIAYVSEGKIYLDVVSKDIIKKLIQV